MTPEQQLTSAAARLARIAPGEWETFLGAMILYTNLNISNCIQSSLEELQRNQGRAQSSARLLSLMTDCLVNADRIQGKAK